MKIFKAKTICYKTSKGKKKKKKKLMQIRRKNFKICKMSWRGNDKI